MMELKVGDVVEFKEYEDITFEEAAWISVSEFPKYGKVSEIISNDGNEIHFSIEESRCSFNSKSVAKVFSDNTDSKKADNENVDSDSLVPGDEVLVKVTIDKVQGDNILAKWVNKNEVVKVLNHTEPQPFIVKDDFYGKYVGEAKTLVNDKSEAKVFKLLSTAKAWASDMNLTVWKVIPYND